MDYKPLESEAPFSLILLFYFKNVQNMMAAMNNDHDLEVYFMEAFILF